jgi:XTP/dITP diphosphohydrolase
MPGVLSARWAGAHGDDDANLQLLLGQTADVPQDRRGAAFVCAAVAVYPDGLELVEEGMMPGRLAHARAGTNGFGYDPIFVAIGQTVTNGELEPAAKDAISHRGQALRALVVEMVRRGI